MNKYLTALTMLCVLGFSSEVPAQTFMRRVHTPVQPEYDSTRIGILKPGKIPQEDKYGLSPT